MEEKFTLIYLRKMNLKNMNMDKNNNNNLIAGFVYQVQKLINLIY
jgi:hypothetical protein